MARAKKRSVKSDQAEFEAEGMEAEAPVYNAKIERKAKPYLEALEQQLEYQRVGRDAKVLLDDAMGDAGVSLYETKSGAIITRSTSHKITVKFPKDDDDE